NLGGRGSIKRCIDLGVYGARKAHRGNQHGYTQGNASCRCQSTARPAHNRFDALLEDKPATGAQGFLSQGILAHLTSSRLLKRPSLMISCRLARSAVSTSWVTTSNVVPA